MRENILIIEDEEALRATLSVRLRGEGYTVDTASTGIEGIEKVTSQPFDLIILDVLLPDLIGWDVCREIRQSGMATPILFLTAKTQTVDKVAGLRLGADEYVTKPFKAAELVARIEALLRRMPTRSSRGVYRFGSLLVDLHRGEVTKDDCPVYLSGREFQLLRYLVHRAGISVSREELLREIWGYSASTYTRTIDVHISSLRDKLEEHPKQPELIITVAGVGYKFMGSKAV